MTAASGLGRLILVTFCVLVFAFLMLPLVIVFPLSVSSASFLQFPPPGFSWKWFEAFFSSASWMRSATLSLQVATLTALLSAFLGVPVAFYLTRARTPWIKAIVEKVMVVPMIVPSIVIAITIYSLMSGLRWVGTWYGLVLAHTVLALPLMVIVVTSGLKQFDVALEQAAIGLGANQIRAFIHVTFPLIRPSVLSGLLFAFMTSFDDLIVALFLSGSNTTLPKKMFENIGYALDPTIAAVCVLEISVLIVVGGLWYILAYRNSGSSGAGMPGMVR
jgi:putative spermidine/putrescine transport system permease protein